MAQRVQRPWRGPDDYDEAVEAAGVTELPDGSSASGRGLPAEVAGGRWEDNSPPVVSR